MSLLGLHERNRRLLIPIAGVAVAGYLLLVFEPLARRADSLDAPLDAAWKKLAIAVGESNATALDFMSIQARLGQTRHAVEVLDSARRQAAERVQLDAELRERLAAPFQLVDFQNEVQRQIADLNRLAKDAGVKLAPAVADGFPAHTADVQQPELLWAELAFSTDLLTLAVNCKVTAIQSLALPMALTNAPPPTNTARLVEIPVHLELSGTASAVTRFLASLPLRTSELAAEKAPAAPDGKPALFIERLLLRKQSPDKPDDVNLALWASGFVLQE